MSYCVWLQYACKQGIFIYQPNAFSKNHYQNTYFMYFLYVTEMSSVISFSVNVFLVQCLILYVWKFVGDSFGGGGAEVSCPNIFSIACPKIMWFCPNITCFLPENCYFKNYRGGGGVAARPKPHAPYAYLKNYRGGGGCSPSQAPCPVRLSSAMYELL